MVIKTPKSLIKLGYEVTEWMDGQRDSQFPFCDSYLMWHYFPPERKLSTYDCTFPHWRKYGNHILEDISTTGTFKQEIEKVVIVRGTDKGIALPQHYLSREAFYVIKSVRDHIPLIISKKKENLMSALEVHEYNLFSWAARDLTYNKLKEGEGMSTGNLFNMNVHLVKGDIIAHVRYYDN